MLNGSRVLVVEGEILIALEIREILLQAGAAAVEVVADVEEAAAFPAPDGFDLVIVEARFAAPEVVAFCSALAVTGSAIIVTSADRNSLASFPGVLTLEKPFLDATLIAACVAALTARS